MTDPPKPCTGAERYLNERRTDVDYEAAYMAARRALEEVEALSYAVAPEFAVGALERVQLCVRKARRD